MMLIIETILFLGMLYYSICYIAISGTFIITGNMPKIWQAKPYNLIIGVFCTVVMICGSLFAFVDSKKLNRYNEPAPIYEKIYEPVNKQLYELVDTTK